MKELKFIPVTVTNILILLVTLFSLFISFQITSNDYQDNRHYSRSYFIMNKHNLSTNSIDTNQMYYLVDRVWHTSCVYKGNIKYFLLDKNKYTRYESSSILDHHQYYLVSCQDAPMHELGVKHEKGFYIRKDRTFNEFLVAYKASIGGSEPIYIFLSYIFSSILDYNYFILLLNLVFLLVVFLALKKFTPNYKYMYMGLVAFDFYFYLYLSTTHRLKLAIIFLLLSYLTHNKTRIIMILSALFSHVQIAIFYLYYLMVALIHNFKLDDILLKKKTYSTYIILACILGFFFLDHIIWKVNYYLQIGMPYKVAALIFLYIIYLFVFKLKDTVKLFIPLAIMVLVIAFFIGSDRINFMLMEFILIVELNRLLNRNSYALFVVVPFILYSIYKSANYIQLGIQ